MDPLWLLPPELVRSVLALLPPADLASLWAVSRGWRDAVADESLWRDAVVVVRGRDAAACLRALRQAPCLAAVHFPRPESPRLLRKVLEALLDVKVRY